VSYRGRHESSYGNIQRLRRFHAHRSKRARKIDESLRAPIAKTSEQWLANPNRFDIPNVDTPKRKDDSLDKIAEERMRQHRSLADVRQRQSMRKAYGNLR
jgi:hypothetical protein